MSLLKELKRRNVIRVAAAYVVIGWLLMQVADVLQGALELPSVFSKALLVLLAIVFIPVLVFAWAFEMTPEGLKRETAVPREASVTAQTARKLDLAVIVLLLVAIGMFAADRFLGPADSQPAQAPGQGALAPVLDPPGDEEPGVPVVAVLPLSALSTEEEGRFLASGLHDDLLTRLAKLQAFKVISRTSVMEYADTTMNIRDIGAELGAGYIVEGGLQAIGGRVSINAQLIDARTDEHLWAETFNRELTTANLFDVQGEIAGAIANALHTTLSAGDLEQLERIPTGNLAAYRAYLRGRETHATLTRPAMLSTVDALTEAVELDPGFAEAWALLARAYLRRYWEEGAEMGGSPDPALREAGREALDRAIALDPHNFETYMAHAFYRYYGFRDYAGALVELGRAEAIAPYDSLVIGVRGFVLRRLGRLDEAADHLLRAMELRRAELGPARETINTLFDAGRCPEASRVAAESLERFPDASGILLMAAITRLVCERDPAGAVALADQVRVTTLAQLVNRHEVLVHAGQIESAVANMRAGRDLFDEVPLERLVTRNLLTMLYRLAGAEAQAQQELEEVTAEAAAMAGDTPYALYQLGYAAALEGDAARATGLGLRALAEFPDDVYIRVALEYAIIRMFALAGADQAAWTLFEEWAPRTTYTELALISVNPHLGRLRAHPRFAEVYAAARERYPQGRWLD